MTPEQKSNTADETPSAPAWPMPVRVGHYQPLATKEGTICLNTMPEGEKLEAWRRIRKTLPALAVHIKAYRENFPGARIYLRWQTKQ